MKWVLLFLSGFNVGLCILMLVDDIRAESMERRAVVISTDCPDTTKVTARYRSMSDYVFALSPCDEIEEYERLVKAYSHIQPRLLIVIVSFSRNCPALRILQTRLKGPATLIVVGCEEVSALLNLCGLPHADRTISTSILSVWADYPYWFYDFV